MTNKMNMEKKVIIAEAVIVVAILAYLFFSMTPTGFSIAGQTIFENDYTLQIQKGDKVIISTNENFDNPIILEEGESADLPPGTYYWKAKNWFRESEVQSFTIHSNVGLDLFVRNDNYGIENSGNVDLNVTKKKGGITSEIPLEVRETKDVEGAEYEGKQK